MQKPKNLTLKYLVIGDSGVGKTSLLVRYCEEAYQAEYLSTIGVDFKIKRIEVQDSHVTLNIWDTAGQQRFRNITKSFYKGAHGIILVYSVTDEESFKHIENWIDQIREAGNAQSQMILVASKSDLENERKVLRKTGEALAEKYQIDFVEASAKENLNVNTIFKNLTETIVKNVSYIDTQFQQVRITKIEKKVKKDQCC